MSPAAPPVIRLCLDLNIWVSDFLAQARGRRGSSSTWLVNAVRDGRCPAGRLQLVVSAGMLDRLALVLARDYPVTEAQARRLAEAIGRTAADGPAAEDPHLVLGGTGVLPIRDEEDRGVLETAVAGRANLLATANLKDFTLGETRGEDWRLYQPLGRGPLLICHPDRLARILRTGGDTGAQLMRALGLLPR